MTKMDAYQTAQQMGAGFVANVIMTQHSNSGRKLKGLVSLLRAGHSVRIADFRIDVLIIDGQRVNWEVLESPSLLEVSREAA